MYMANNENGGCRIYLGGGFMGLFFLVLFVLKVCGIGMVANWPWLWVTSPLWIPAAITASVFIIGSFISLAVFIIGEMRNWR